MPPESGAGIGRAPAEGNPPTPETTPGDQNTESPPTEFGRSCFLTARCNRFATDFGTRFPTFSSVSMTSIGTFSSGKYSATAPL